MSGLRHRNVAKDSGDSSSSSSIMEKVKRFDAYSKPMEVNFEDPLSPSAPKEPLSLDDQLIERYLEPRLSLSLLRLFRTFEFKQLRELSVRRRQRTKGDPNSLGSRKGLTLPSVWKSPCYSDHCKLDNYCHSHNIRVSGVSVNDHGGVHGGGEESSGQDVDSNEHHISARALRP